MRNNLTDLDMDTETKLLGLLQEAATIVHKYSYETAMPIKDVCSIVLLLANNYAENIYKMPEDEYTIMKAELDY